MTPIFKSIIKNHNRIFQVFIVLIFSIIISFLISDKTIHSFDFEKGSVWRYDDLYSNFNFSIFKTEEEIEKNKKDIEFYSDVYYEKDTILKRQFINNFELELKSRLRSKNKVSKLFDVGEIILLKIYNYGIIDLRELDLNRKFIQVISQEYEMNNFQNFSSIKQIFSFKEILLSKKFCIPLPKFWEE